MVLGSFVGGILLGVVMHFSGSVVLCIGLHMGQNLAVLLGGGVSVEAVSWWVAAVGIASLSLVLLELSGRERRVPTVRGPRARPRSLLASMGAASLALFILALGTERSSGPSAPRGLFEELEVPPPPDFSRAENWAALPWRTDMADVVPISVAARPQETLSGDAFFVHPTTSFSEDRWNEAPADESASNLVDALVLANQASAFNGCCRVFAPRYRQATFAAFIAEGLGAKKARDLAYEDIRRAFAFYLSHYAGGRPIVVAGHSQGSYHALRLLEEFFGEGALRERLVAAYLIGIPVPSWKLETELGLPVCGSPLETGCVIVWNTVSPHGDRSLLDRAATILYGEASAEPKGRSFPCVNPLTWTDTAGYAASELNLGGVVFAKEIDRPGEPRPGVADAECQEGLLVARTVADSGFRRALGPGGDYHLLDFGLFYLNIHENARARLAAYVRRRASDDLSLAGEP
jgi:hypothetical protein